MSFYLILDKVQINKKHELLNTAEVNFWSFVNDGMMSLPGLEILLSDNDPASQRDRVREMAKFVLNKWIGVQVQNVKAGHFFSFGDTGKILFKSEEIPDYFDWIFLAIEDDTDVRDLGSDIDKVLPDDQIDSLAKNIFTIAAASVTPQAAAAIVVAKELVRGITYFMKKDKNDQLGLVEQSFIRELHYPNGKRTSSGNTDLTRNMMYDYTIFGIDK
jgi:hypothetical protein